MPRITIDISGALPRDMRQLRADLRRGIAAGLRESAETVMTTSKESYVPVDTGALRSSGFVDEVQDFGDHMEVSMGYGGAAKDYALIVHERLDVQHTVGGAKYLEVPAHNFAPQVPGVMQKHLARLGH